jgi:hypothetical protein
MSGASGWLLVVSHLFAVSVSVLWVGGAKKKITKLGCEKYCECDTAGFYVYWSHF